MIYSLLRALARAGSALALATLAMTGPVVAAPVGSFDFTESGGPATRVGGGLLFSESDGIGGWIGRLRTSTISGASFDTLATFAASPSSSSGGFDITGDVAFIFDDVDGATAVDDVLIGTFSGVLSGMGEDRVVDLTYALTGGSGLFAGFSGTGSSTLRYSVVGGEPYSYSGVGELSLVGPAAVPEPGTLVLVVFAVLAAWACTPLRRTGRLRAQFSI
jgi:hypothetical protein